MLIQQTVEFTPGDLVAEKLAPDTLGMVVAILLSGPELAATFKVNWPGREGTWHEAVELCSKTLPSQIGFN
jgi:hypothetical protein